MTTGNCCNLPEDYKCSALLADSVSITRAPEGVQPGAGAGLIKPGFTVSEEGCKL